VLSSVCSFEGKCSAPLQDCGSFPNATHGLVTDASGYQNILCCSGRGRDPSRRDGWESKLSKSGGRYGFFRVYFVEEIKTSGSVRNQVAGGFPIYRSISNNVAWKCKPSPCHLYPSISNNVVWKRNPSTLSSLPVHQQQRRMEAQALTLSSLPSISNNVAWKRNPSLCHLYPPSATMLHGSANPHFVIPNEAEGLLLAVG
jgi:hypothetical protein